MKRFDLRFAVAVASVVLIQKPSKLLAVADPHHDQRRHEATGALLIDLVDQGTNLLPIRVAVGEVIDQLDLRLELLLEFGVEMFVVHGEDYPYSHGGTWSARHIARPIAVSCVMPSSRRPVSSATSRMLSP